MRKMRWTRSPFPPSAVTASTGRSGRQHGRRGDRLQRSALSLRHGRRRRAVGANADTIPAPRHPPVAPSPASHWRLSPAKRPGEEDHRGDSSAIDRLDQALARRRRRCDRLVEDRCLPSPGSPGPEPAWTSGGTANATASTSLRNSVKSVNGRCRTACRAPPSLSASRPRQLQSQPRAHAPALAPCVTRANTRTYEPELQSALQSAPNSSPRTVNESLAFISPACM